jgi:hypothetical protein
MADKLRLQKVVKIKAKLRKAGRGRASKFRRESMLTVGSKGYGAL